MGVDYKWTGYLFGPEGPGRIRQASDIVMGGRGGSHAEKMQSDIESGRMDLMQAAGEYYKAGVNMGIFGRGDAQRYLLLGDGSTPDRHVKGFPRVVKFSSAYKNSSLHTGQAMRDIGTDLGEVMEKNRGVVLGDYGSGPAMSTMKFAEDLNRGLIRSGAGNRLGGVKMIDRDPWAAFTAAVMAEGMNSESAATGKDGVLPGVKFEAFCGDALNPPVGFGQPDVALSYHSILSYMGPEDARRFVGGLEGAKAIVAAALVNNFDPVKHILKNPKEEMKVITGYNWQQLGAGLSGDLRNVLATTAWSLGEGRKMAAVHKQQYMNSQTMINMLRENGFGDMMGGGFEPWTTWMGPGQGAGEELGREEYKGIVIGAVREI